MNTNKRVYVDLDSLEEWSNIIGYFNDSAMGIIDAFQGTIDDLGNYYEGGFANTFIDDSTDFIKMAKNLHNKMKDVPVMLKDIIVVKDNV